MNRPYHHRVLPWERELQPNLLRLRPLPRYELKLLQSQVFVLLYPAGRVGGRQDLPRVFARTEGLKRVQHQEMQLPHQFFALLQ